MLPLPRDLSGLWSLAIAPEAELTKDRRDASSCIVREMEVNMRVFAGPYIYKHSIFISEFLITIVVNN